MSIDLNDPNSGSDLGEILRRLRKAASLSGERLALRCAMSQSTISRIERGKHLPSVTDVERILAALEVPREAADKIIALARRANVEHVSVRALAEKGLWRNQLELKALTENSSVVRSFLPVMPSGLLQVPEYARAVLSPTIPNSVARDVDKAVTARLDWQNVLDRPTNQFFFLMTEQAVRLRRADRDVMARQCAHMVTVSERQNVEIAIVPLTTRVPDSPMNTFLILDDRMVIVELFSGRVVLRDYRDVRYHLEHFELFHRHALTGDRARAFLLSACDEFL